MFNNGASNTINHLFLILLFVNLCGHIINGQDLAFQESEDDDPNRQNANNKKPLHTNLCPPGELLYPGDQKDDYVCDCIPGYLYYPNTNRCYGAHRQGPCANGQKLTLPTNRNIPECRQNFCREDGLVQLNRMCYKLNEPGPCENPELSNVLGIDTRTFALKCIRSSDVKFPMLTTRFGDDEDEETETQSKYAVDDVECRIGSRRSYNGKC